jgi:DNA polymerase I
MRLETPRKSDIEAQHYDAGFELGGVSTEYILEFVPHEQRIKNGQLSAKEQRSAVSQVVQGTASLIFKKALLEVGKIDDVVILLPMHDALVFEHSLPETPAQVVAAFENVMTAQLDRRVNGKASISSFVPT